MVQLDKEVKQQGRLFHISLNAVLGLHHFMETVIKKSSLRRKLLPGSVPSQNVSGRTSSRARKKTASKATYCC